MADKFHSAASEKPVDIVFTLDENEWNKQCHLQMKVIDLRLALMNQNRSPAYGRSFIIKLCELNHD